MSTPLPPDPARYHDLRAHIEEFLPEMDRDERLVKLGRCSGYYSLGAITVDEYEALAALLGFTSDDLDRLDV